MGPTAFARLTAVSGVQADVCHSTPLVDGGPETIGFGSFARRASAGDQNVGPFRNLV